MLRDLIADGFSRCSQCKETKSLEHFYLSDSYRNGVSSRCRDCTKEEIRRRNKTSKTKARRKAYLSRPDVIARLRAWKKATPRHTLAIRLNAALKRRPTETAVTLDELVQMWRDQDGLCALSGVEMTWRDGETTPTSISIDRKDCGLGYTRRNIRLICVQVNLFKGRWSDEQMLGMAHAIVNRAKKIKK